MAIMVDDREIAPCICANARFALGIKKIPPTNTKACSSKYWYRTVDYFGKLHSCNLEIIKEAKGRSDLYTRPRNT